MRKVKHTAAQILDLADTHYATSMTFDDADSVSRRNNTTVSVWNLLSSDYAEVTVTIVENSERNTDDYVELSVTVKRV
jgi:hypothetical protein